ncbi:MAG: Gfo/Idh/MocA family oxidoreductase [Ruminococcaceae bacterium]|nr:Gfo/Idh/MocA family oxidoreductase [Oscillospiraceae bacterium]
MKKVRIGVLGAYRGSSMINYCKRADNAEVVAICDKSPEALEAQRKIADGLNITFYENFEDFIKHDMDAVVLANYANEHAPFAIRAMKLGLHVFSEVLPCQTMKEAVELVETVEETGKIYAYGENYCYMPAPYEMKKLYRQGKIGEFEYGECEYIHNCESIWPSITYGERDHWRNNMYSTFYCTHSLGPIIHMTGLRPVSVIGFEGVRNERNLRTGAKGGQFGIEMVTLENGGIIKSINGGLYKNSIWYCAYGSKGRMECGREDAKDGHIHKIYVNADAFSGDYQNEKLDSYEPKNDVVADVEGFGHGGSDFYSMYHFVEKINGNKDADTIDVYEALDMFLPGMFAYRSILKGGIPMEIPNLRDKSVRKQWSDDTTCTDPKVAGDMLLPTFSKGTPDIDDGVYEHMKNLWEAECQSGRDNYRSAAFNQGIKK